MNWCPQWLQRGWVIQGTKGFRVVVRVVVSTDWSVLEEGVVHLVLMSAMVSLHLVSLLFWAWS